jgi:hypothetical protein
MIGYLIYFSPNFVTPVISLLFLLPKIHCCGIFGTNSYSCYIPSLNIFHHLLITIGLVSEINLIWAFDYWDEIYQNISSYLNSWIEAIEKTVQLLLIFLLLFFSDVCSYWENLTISANAIE